MKKELNNKNEKIEETKKNEEVKVEELTEETLEETNGGIVGVVGLTLGYWSVCYLAGIAHGYCK